MVRARARAAIMAAALLAVAAGMAACTRSSLPRPTAGAGTPGVQGSSGILWLCRPGLAGNPCTVSPAATSVGPSGQRTLALANDVANPPFNCFYVYPTVVGGRRPCAACSPA